MHSGLICWTAAALLGLLQNWQFGNGHIPPPHLGTKVHFFWTQFLWCLSSWIRLVLFGLFQMQVKSQSNPANALQYFHYFYQTILHLRICWSLHWMGIKISSYFMCFIDFKNWKSFSSDHFLQYLYLDYNTHILKQNLHSFALKKSLSWKSLSSQISHLHALLLVCCFRNMMAVPALRFLLINIKFEMLYLILLNPNAVLFCISISVIMVGFYSLLPMKKVPLLLINLSASW